MPFVAWLIHIPALGGQTRMTSIGIGPADGSILRIVAAMRGAFCPEGKIPFGVTHAYFSDSLQE
jgi:hypothetical protein